MHKMIILFLFFKSKVLPLYYTFCTRRDNRYNGNKDTPFRKNRPLQMHQSFAMMHLIVLQLFPGKATSSGFFLKKVPLTLGFK